MAGFVPSGIKDFRCSQQLINTTTNQKNMSVEKETTGSWGSRLGGSFKGILILAAAAGLVFYLIKKKKKSAKPTEPTPQEEKHTHLIH